MRHCKLSLLISFSLYRGVTVASYTGVVRSFRIRLLPNRYSCELWLEFSDCFDNIVKYIMSSKHGMAKLLAISTVLLLYQRLSLATLACKRGESKMALTNTAACAGGDKCEQGCWSRRYKWKGT